MPQSLRKWLRSLALPRKRKQSSWRMFCLDLRVHTHLHKLLSDHAGSGPCTWSDHSAHAGGHSGFTGHYVMAAVVQEGCFCSKHPLLLHTGHS